jgi:hypothetical protein
MTETEFISAIRDIAVDHSGCDPECFCSLNKDVDQLLKEYDEAQAPKPAEKRVAKCSVPNCDNILTILDFFRCRQCVLQGRR